MLPNWMIETDAYIPSNEGNAFVVKSMKTIGKIMSRIQIQKGHEKGRTLSPLFKLFMVIIGILILSITQNKLIIMAYAACILLYLCTWPPKDIARIMKAATVAALFTVFILIPAVILDPTILTNEIRIVVKVFFSVLSISIFNHTTQWNHITGAMHKLHIPGIFIFTIDITLKYIVLLGNLIYDLLTSLQFRSIGKNNKKYTSIGGIMGVTFIRGAEMNKEMYEAMLCRGFSDDYKGL